MEAYLCGGGEVLERGVCGSSHVVVVVIVVVVRNAETVVGSRVLVATSAKSCQLPDPRCRDMTSLGGTNESRRSRRARQRRQQGRAGGRPITLLDGWQRRQK